MADNNTLNIKIGAQIEGLKKSLDDAKSEVNGFGEKLEGTLTKGAKSSTNLTNGVKKSSKAIQEADKHTNGLASALIDVSESAKVAGDGMKSALITSGIGAAVIALGLIVQHWDDIKNLIDDSNVKLQQHINELQRGADIIGDEIALNKKREAFLKYQGKSTEDIVNANRELYAKQQSSNVLLLHKLKIQNATLTALSTEATWWEKLQTLQSGRIATTRKQSEEDKKAAADRLKEINALEIAIEGVKFDVFKIDNPKAATSTFIGQVSTAMEGVKSSLEPVMLSVRDAMQIIKPEDMINQATILTEGQLHLLSLMADFNEEANNLIQGNIASTFANLGDAIGRALAEGGNVLSAIGSTILQSLASFLSEMGGLLIKYGTLAVIKGKVDKAIAVGGATAIAAGVAAIALGVALKAAGAAIGSFANSGSRSGSSRRGATENVGGSGSRSYSGGNATGGGYSGGGTVVFEIAGTKLVGVLSKTLSRNSALGGNLSLSYGS